MGHRALVAVDRADGRYDLYRSQWGADDHRLRTVLDAPNASVGFLLDALGVESTARGVPVAGVLDALDPLTDEGLLVLDGERTVYLVIDLRVATAGRTAASTTATTVSAAAVPTEASATAEAALVPIADVDAARRIRRFVRTVADVLGDAVDAGLVPPALARAYLRTRIAAHPDVSPDALWIGGDRATVRE